MIARLIVALMISFGAITGGAAAQVARTEQGRARGFTEDGVTAFLGIPYAAPPTASLRWRPPEAALAWRGVRDAGHFAPACMQSGVSMPGEPVPRMSEDCLYLNVWTPGLRRRAPVMVWIHGGGYTNGATSLPLYWGDRLASRGVVVVTIAYRLGAMGFLAHPELTAEGGGSSGNYGLRDQIAALRWVRRNISAFGGDPGNVTVFGQSAGAMSISLLMASPEARGLFHRAIAQSGGVFEPVELAPHYLLENAESDGLSFARSLGADSVAELRALPAERLIEGAARVSHPVIEPGVLPRSPYDAYVAGSVADIPIVVGSNAEEAHSLIDVSDVTKETFTAHITAAWGALPPPLLGAYAAEDDNGAREARLAFDRDLRFGWDMWAWARLHALRATHPVFYYRFSHRPPFSGSDRERWGAAHFAELWYMFDHLDAEDGNWSADDRALAQRMADYWVAFASSGDPNSTGLPQWPTFTQTRPLLIDLAADPETRTAPVDPGLRVFDAVYDAVRGAPFGAAP